MNTENPERSGPHPGVRRRTDGDLAECVRVLAEVHAQDRYPLDWPDRPAAWLSQGPVLGSWVAELDGRLAGHVSLSRAGDDDLAPGLWSERSGAARETAAVVGRLFVAPAARGHRIGALLIGRAVREAHDRGLHPVLDVVTSDTAAAALYERLGWQRMATVDQRWDHRTVTLACYTAPS
ncbi:GNAT family N-acetyltransferase [Streptomyces sp. NPDC004311]|uniref:GNAT family N-acetyltransferase n=1 Tax=unclassified Streptomyces TaxID=2593676 RepID=UPI0036A0C328